MNDKTDELAEQAFSQQSKQRREKLGALREHAQAYPNDFRPDALAAALHASYEQVLGEDLEATPIRVRIAGRMMTQRVMGKASFAHLRDSSGQMQVYVRRDELPEGAYAEFKKYDLGDILGVEGRLFRTRTGELSVHVESIRLLVKCLLPLPDKWDGLTDTETRYRQRYLDLAVNPEVRDVFRVRSEIVSYIRRYFLDADFLEVETPMMHPIPGGAVARPFVTHHNTLDMRLFLRIAPELYLKRLVVGGLERVFEINRNFRNEGVSTRHNPEFTMLEFYEAYVDYEVCMDRTEELFHGLAEHLTGGSSVVYQGTTIDFSGRFARLTMEQAILEHNPELDAAALRDEARVRDYASARGVAVQPGWGLGKLWQELFDETAEEHLVNPTFIHAYPTEVSPLSRGNEHDPFVTDRFEFFIAGREIANGFSELNDPDEQAARFRAQVEARDAGDAEAMYFDADYIRALEYGMPPAGGEGIGIDRVVMLFTNAASIRDVLLFPHMRPES